MGRMGRDTEQDRIGQADTSQEIADQKTGIWKTGGAQAVGKAHRQFIRNRTHGAWQPGSLPAQQSSGLSVSGGEPFGTALLCFHGV